MTATRRRPILGTLITLLVGAFAALSLAGCSSSSDPESRETSPTRPATSSLGDGRVAVVFFSRAGENYWEGGRRDLEVGNTKVVAAKIAAQTDVELIQIEAAEPYPDDYDETVKRNQREQESDARPEIAEGVPDLSRYDTIILGSPVWNTRAPMIMHTLLEGNDLAGKTIHPFVTYAISEGSVFDDYAEMYPDATITDGLGIQGEHSADADDQITQWLTEQNLATR